MKPISTFFVHVSSDSLVLSRSNDDDHIHQTVELRARMVGADDFSVDVEKLETFSESSSTKKIICAGVMGAVLLPAGPHLLIVDEWKEMTDDVLGFDFSMVKKVSVVAFPSTYLPEKEKPNLTFEALLVNGFENSNMYFCQDYPVTLSVQRSVSAGIIKPDSSVVFDPKKLMELADERFLWNYAFLACMSSKHHKESDNRSIPVLDDVLYPYIVQIMSGFVGISRTSISGSPFTFVVLSRRARHRTGTRYHRRGIDASGNVANYAETEQMIVTQTKAISFVQVRGSVPVPWGQTLTTKYTPPMWLDLPHITKPVTKTDPKVVESDPLAKYWQPVPSHISPIEGPLGVFSSHFDRIAADYGGQVVAADLLNWHGFEERLHKSYEMYSSDHSASKKNSNLKYVPFDFHKECSKLRWHNLNKLVDIVAEDIRSEGFTTISRTNLENGRSWRVSNSGSIQRGVIRTNCLDSLDRTNVVQSMFAKESLRDQLKVLGIKTENGRDEFLPADFLHLFKNIWADNADAVANAYAGTGALKTDFTRTGKRTQMGALQDGYKSVTRYIKNNFMDGQRQDSIDMSVGEWIATESNVNKIESPAGWPLPVVMIIYAFITLLFLVFTGKLGSFNGITLLVAFISVFAASFKPLMRYYGPSIINMPILNPSNASSGGMTKRDLDSLLSPPASPRSEMARDLKKTE